jgi:hypothetical protein
MNICLIVDSEYISKWEYDAIVYAESRSNFKIHSVLFCTNSTSQRRYFKHFLYFALNLIAMRNQWTKRVAWSNLISDKSYVKKFEAEDNGKWQTIPSEIHAWLDTSPPDVVLKFGMNLLRDPEKLPSKFGVLSFHHGDPEKFRGRPAGFYEILSDAQEIGVIVQRLTNSLDGGEIVSFGAFKIYGHSYKRTLENAYGGGRYLLLKALNNLDHPQSKDSLGKIYRLPTNLQVVSFFWNVLARKIRWIIGVLFLRKKWSISTTSKSINDVMADSDLSHNSTKLYTPKDFAFAADPFFLQDGSIICEVVEKGKRIGQLATASNGNFEIIDSPHLEKTKHNSFPFVSNIEELHFLLPEMASHGQQRLLELDQNNQITRSIPLKGLKEESLIDPIITVQDGTIWLFAGKLGSDLDCLFLWSSKSIHEPFVEHKLNPIVCSPKFARNAGAIFKHEGHLYRPAQNCTVNYGDGISIMRIESISQTSYIETLAKSIKFTDSFGPHTINFAENITVFDDYKKVFDPFAWKTKVFI